MKRNMILSAVVLPSLIMGLAGCGTWNIHSPSETTGSSTTTASSTTTTDGNQAEKTHTTGHNQQPKNLTSDTNLGNTTASNASGSNRTVGAPTQAPSVGWRYVDIPKSLGGNSQIVGITPSNGKIQLTIMSGQSNQYSKVSYDIASNGLSGLERGAEAPENYQGPWKLVFGRMSGHTPVPMKLVQDGNAISIPSSIPAYASEINPAPGNPASYDNRILGQTGKWVWMAMKGPAAPPIPELVWGYRQWDRILAINTQTHGTRVFAIPKSTSETNTWGTTPGFGVIGNTVYVATGHWVGTFPAAPTNQHSVPVLVPEPTSKVTADQAAMLKTLSTLESQAATGIASFWNNYVMKGNQKAMGNSWILQPNIFNHGDFPPDLYWAVNFPLKSGTEAYKQRAMLVREIEQMLKSPLTTAWVVYPDPASMRSHFHSTPPTKLPGYQIVNGLYVKASDSQASP